MRKLTLFLVFLSLPCSAQIIMRGSGGDDGEVTRTEIDTDDFNRTASSIATAGNWTTAGAGIGADGADAIRGSVGGGTGRAMNTTAGFSADQYAEVELTSYSATGGGGNVFVYARMSDNTSTFDGYGCVSFAAGGGGVQLHRIDNGTATQLDAVTPQSFTTLDDLAIEVVGSTISCLYNDVVVLSTTDATYTTGSPGFQIYSNTDTATQVNSFTAGNLE